MLKPSKNNMLKRIIAALSAGVLVFSGNAGFSNQSGSAVYAITGEYRSWKQSDPRWGSICLGGSRETISQSGCAVTSVACLVVHAGCLDESEINPGILCEFLNQNGGLDGSGNIYWGVVSKFVPEFHFDRTVYLYGSTAEEKAAEIKSYLDQGFYAVSDVRYSGHWVAIDKVEDGIVYSMDPAYGASTNMFEQYDFNGSTRLKLFRKGSVEIQTSVPVSVVYTTGEYRTASKMNLRSEASVTSEKLDVVENNYKINVTEISGNWGKVRYNGKTGWICLDYSIKVGDAEPEKNYTEGTYILKEVMHYREDADASSVSYGTIQKNTTLNISEVSFNWGKTIYNGQNCWVCLDYSERISDLPVEQVAETTKISETPEDITQRSAGAYKTTEPLNFRSGAGTDNIVFCVIPSGTDVIVSEVSGDWGRIVYNDKTGWISLNYAVGITTEEVVQTESYAVTEAPKQQAASVTETILSENTEVAPVETNVPVTTEVSTDRSASDIISLQTSAPEVTEAAMFPGDVNEDGTVNSMDMVFLIDVFLNDNVTSANFKRFDINDDKVVSSKDIITLKFILLSGK